MIWSKPELSPSAVPQLGENEKLLLTVAGVGLYNGDTKSAEHSNGTIYLSSRHLVYVDSAQPILNSVKVEVGQLKDIDYTPRFLKSSAKIHLKLSEPLSTNDDDNNNNNSNSNNTMGQNRGDWVCSICSFSNTAAATVCATCGVKKQADTAVYVTPVAETLAPGECPQCTFRNHPSLKFCEMCGAPLKRESTVLSSSLGSSVKISFRKGQSHEFWARLQEVVAQSTSDVSASISESSDTQDSSSGTTTPLSFGIRTLRARTQQRQAFSIETLNRALQSPENFKKLMPEIVAIAERLKPLASEDALPTIIGASSDDADSVARQLVDLLIGSDDLLARAGGMMSLHDCYAMYNRCRGLGLVTTQQFWNALNRCEPLGLPLRVRTLASGLKVVESRGGLDQALQRLLHWIKQETEHLSWRESSGFSARDVSDQFGCSVQVALEELLLAEQRGKLCRDEHTSGLRFFPNLIVG